MFENVFINFNVFKHVSEERFCHFSSVNKLGRGWRWCYQEAVSTYSLTLLHAPNQNGEWGKVDGGAEIRLLTEKHFTPVKNLNKNDKIKKSTNRTEIIHYLVFCQKHDENRHKNKVNSSKFKCLSSTVLSSNWLFSRLYFCFLSALQETAGLPLCWQTFSE